MERRKQPRIRLPLEIELSHPFIGQRTVVARDLTDEGVYAWYPDAPFKIGSSIDIRLKGAPMIESRPTPKVKVRVSRIDGNGVMLSFINKSGAHLWRSAIRKPEELSVGKDLFRVFQAAVVQDAAGRVLTVQQNGRWLFPGNYLQVGEAWCAMLQDYLARTLNLTETIYLRTVLTHNDSEVVAKESSTMSVFHLYKLPPPATQAGSANPAEARPRIQPAEDSPYSKARWIDNLRQLEELSFSAEPLRELARSLIPGEHTNRRRTPNDREGGQVTNSAPTVAADEDALRKHG